MLMNRIELKKMIAGTPTSLQRKSVFPPLLGYERDTSISNGKGERMQSQPTATASKQERQSVNPRISKPAIRTLTNERDAELRQRQHTKAEALVRMWDSLLVREREDRHVQLLQRLDLQRMLIAKNDLAFRQSLRDAEEKRLQEVQTRRDRQKKIIRDLRAHAKRIDEHKKMVAEKVEERGFSASQPERVVVSAELRHLQFEETHEGGPEELLSDGFPADFGHTSRLQQLLDFDPVREATPTISSAWVMLKRYHSRKLQPIMEYSLHTRELANPTSKVLLKYYDEPIKLSKSGEKVPLSEVLEVETQKIELNLRKDSMLTRALELRTRGNQVRAEALLHRKQTQVKVPIQEPTMYLPKEEYEYLDEPLHHPPPFMPSEREPVRHSPIEHVSKRKKWQPMKYLTEEGVLSSSSLENSKQKQEAAKSTFLTDQDEECERGIMDYVVDAKPGSRWQPLSCNAAQEYSGTRVLATRVFSSQGNGRYSSWKPLSSHYIQPKEFITQS